MRKEPLSLDHQEILEPRLRALQFDLSEYTFACLYLFRSIHAYEVLFGEEGIYVAGKTRDGHTYVMPTCRPTHEACCKEIKELLHSYEFLYPIPMEWLPCFSPRLFESSHIDADTDYLFRTEKFCTYPGRHLSSRRNLLKQFKELYPEHRTEPIIAANKRAALELLERWQMHAHPDKRFTDYDSAKEALEKLEKLNLDGRLTLCEERPVGFVIGEPLSQTTYVLHTAKGDVVYKGVYQYIYSDLAYFLEKRFEFLNLEQDLGSEDLAHAKRAYDPDRLLPKMRIHLKT